MELNHKYPSDLTAPIHNKHEAPNPAQPAAQFDSGYLDGSVSGYEGANAGRDQDRSRLDEYQCAMYTYPSGAGGSASENETGTMEGF